MIPQVYSGCDSSGQSLTSSPSTVTLTHCILATLASLPLLNFPEPPGICTVHTRPSCKSLRRCQLLSETHPDGHPASCPTVLFSKPWPPVTSPPPVVSGPSPLLMQTPQGLGSQLVCCLVTHTPLLSCPLTGTRVRRCSINSIVRLEWRCVCHYETMKQGRDHGEWSLSARPVFDVHTFDLCLCVQGASAPGGWPLSGFPEFSKKDQTVFLCLKIISLFQFQ